MEKIEQQIKLFKEETGIQLEIKDGKPYYGNRLDFSNNKNLTQIPDNLVVIGDLDVSDTNLTSLPNGLVIYGSLFILCTEIKELPSDIIIGKSLHAKNSKLEELPNGFKCGGIINLIGTNVKDLPSGLQIIGDVYGLSGGDIFVSDHIKNYLAKGSVDEHNVLLNHPYKEDYIEWYQESTGKKFCSMERMFLAEIVEEHDKVKYAKILLNEQLICIITDGKGKYAFGFSLEQATIKLMLLKYNSTISKDKEEEIVDFINIAFSEENKEKYNTPVIKVVNIEDINKIKALDMPNDIMVDYFYSHIINNSLKYVVYYKDIFKYGLSSIDGLIGCVQCHIENDFVFTYDTINKFKEHIASFNEPLTEELFENTTFYKKEEIQIESFRQFINEVFKHENVKKYNLPHIWVNKSYNIINCDVDFILFGLTIEKTINTLIRYINEKDRDGRISNIFIYNPDFYIHVINLDKEWAEFLFGKNFRFWLHRKSQDELLDIINNSIYSKAIKYEN